jgi:hypothetical protein
VNEFGALGLDPDREYRVAILSPRVTSLGIEAVTFVPREFTPPACGVVLHLADGPTLRGELKPHEYVLIAHLAEMPRSSGTALLLTLIVLMHYIDLLVPLVIVDQSSHASNKRSRGRRDEAQRPVAEPPVAIRRELPRTQRHTSREQLSGDTSQKHRRGAAIDAFRRRLPTGHTPSIAKVMEADSFGIDLKGPGYPAIRYTWVRPHSRGNEKAVPSYIYTDYRACDVLDTIFDVLDAEH